jgi:hypothetical protein
VVLILPVLRVGLVLGVLGGLVVLTFTVVPTLGLRESGRGCALGFAFEWAPLEDVSAAPAELEEPSEGSELSKSDKSGAFGSESEDPITVEF